jgi:hypothetical protein
VDARRRPAYRVDLRFTVDPVPARPTGVAPGQLAASHRPGSVLYGRRSAERGRMPAAALLTGAWSAGSREPWAIVDPEASDGYTSGELILA